MNVWFLQNMNIFSFSPTYLSIFFFWSPLLTFSWHWTYIYRMIQRSVPPPLYSKIGKCCKKSKSIPEKYRQKYVICKKKQILTPNFHDFRAFRNDAPMNNICNFLWFSRFLNFGPFLMIKSVKAITDMTEVCSSIEN